MSVLIKDMKMPEGCLSCGFHDDESNYCKAKNEFVNFVIMRHSKDADCPLIELPEKHGRLVDRDAIMKKLDIAEDCTNCIYHVGSLCGRSNSFVDACETICDAPTIIEAEGDEG